MSVAAALVACAISAVAVQAADATSQTLVYAVYNGENTASDVFKTMQSAQSGTGERITGTPSFRRI